MTPAAELQTIRLIQAVCRRPARYTVNGTLAEALSFLAGCYCGLAAARSVDVGRDAHAAWDDFLGWVSAQLPDCPSSRIYDIGRALRAGADDDTAALQLLGDLSATYYAVQSSAASAAPTLPHEETALASLTYSALLFLPEGSAISFDALRSALETATPGVSIQPDGEKALQLRFGDWGLRVALEDASYVAEESRELAATIRDRAVARRLARSVSRISVWSRDPDTKDTHAGDCRAVLRTLQTGLPGSIAWDAASGLLR